MSDAQQQPPSQKSNDYRTHVLQLAQLLAILVGFGSLVYQAGSVNERIVTQGAEIDTLRQIAADLVRVSVIVPQNQAELRRLEDRILRLERHE